MAVISFMVQARGTKRIGIRNFGFGVGPKVVW
jgi:hypothetical protein